MNVDLTMGMFLSFIVALSLSALALPVLIRHAANWHLLDIPDARKRHVGLIPRVGGIAIALGTVVVALTWSLADPVMIGFLLGSLVIVLFGVLDDRNNLDFRVKFGGQIVAAVIATGCGLQLHHLPFMNSEFFPSAILFPLTVILLLAATNAFNLLDGLDGLAAGCASLSLATVAALALSIGDDGQVALVAAAALGSILGFLRYNTHPAIVYMGDAGSQFLGFSIGALAILLIERSNGALSSAIILPILGLPVIDTLMVMLLRIRDGRSPFSPDRNHIHHKLLSVGLSHRQAVAAIYIVQATLVAAAVLLRHQSDALIVCIYSAICAMCVLAYFTVRHLHRGATLSHIPGGAGVSNTTEYGGWREKARNYLIGYVEFSVMLYLIGGALVLDTVAADISIIALCSAAITIAFAFWSRTAVQVIRLATYLAAIYVSYLSSISAGPWWLSSVPFYLWLGSVGVAVCAVIVLKSNDRFQVSTQDLLAILVILGIIALPTSVIDTSLVAAIAFRAIVFIYACELLITLRATKGHRIALAAVLSLLTMAMLHALPGSWEVVRSLWNMTA